MTNSVINLLILNSFNTKNALDIPLIEAEKKPQKDVVLDPNGFFIIEIIKNEIRVEYYLNVYKNDKIVSGKLRKIFHGDKADALCDTIEKHVKDLRYEHYMYLGRELQKAQFCLEQKNKYVQGGC